MTTKAYRDVIAVSKRDRLDLFLSAATRLGAPVGNIEKDFWVCWTLDALYHRRPAGDPRLLFKGGTSLSKAYNLIKRFSEDIDVTVFRDDIGESASVEDLQNLSNRKRRVRLDAIRDACRAYITGPLFKMLTAELDEATAGAGRVEVDPDDVDGQTLLIWYPAIESRDAKDLRRAIRIESGAKSALDPNKPAIVHPYIAEDIPEFDLSVPEVITIEAERTFWDKVIIVHGLRRWFERRNELRHEGQQVSRHYYDLHCLLNSEAGRAARKDPVLAVDCVQHARMFFNRADYDLASAVAGTFALTPVEGMKETLSRDYDRTVAMIFGEPPGFDIIMQSIRSLETDINRSGRS